MAAFGSTVAAVTRLLDGAVYLDPEAFAAKASQQQLSATVLVRSAACVRCVRACVGVHQLRQRTLPR
jgi:hypothetical protein